MTVDEAVAKGIDKIRKPIWINKDDHIKLDIINGTRGPWVHFYSPVNVPVGNKNPVSIIYEGDSATDWEEYKPVSPERKE